MASSKNRNIANIELSKEMENNIPFVSSNIAQAQDIPESLSSSSNEFNSGSSVVNNNYNVNVNVDGKAGTNINKNSTTNIIKNVTQQNNITNSEVLKKNSQENFAENGPSNSPNLNVIADSNIFNNYLKNESLDANDSNNYIKNEQSTSNINSVSISNSNSNSVMPSVIESGDQLDSKTTLNVSNNSNVLMPGLTENKIENNSNLNIQNIIKNETKLTDYANPEKEIGNIDEMKFISDGSSSTIGENILYNENTFVQKREEKINQILGHTDTDNNITTNQNNVLSYSADNTIKNQTFLNQESQTDFINDTISNLELNQNQTSQLNIDNSQQTLNTQKVFNDMSSFEENVNNSFITNQNGSSRISFNTEDIDTSQDDKIAEISKIIREKSLKEAETAIKEEEARKENKNKETSKQIKGEEGAEESIDMQEDGKSRQDIASRTEASAPLISAQPKKEFIHMIPTPSDIQMFYKKMNSPPIWRTVNS